MKKFLLKFALFSVFLFVVLEVVFRVFLPAATMPLAVQYEEYGILALEKDQASSGQHTIGRFCRPSYHWNVNNDGFNSAIDYRPAAERDLPCAVVIGNSYALGFYSDVDEHLAGQLHRELGDRMEVYNLAVSGMPMSQVPLVAHFAQEKYGPDLIIIQSSARSVDGSLATKARNPYSQQFSVRDGEIVTHAPRRFVANKYKYIVLKSALVRYLLYNANYNLGGKGLVQDAVEKPRTPGAVDAPDPAVAMVLEEAMRRTAEAAPGDRVLVVQDADRAAMYESGSKPDRLRNSEILEETCERFGFEFLDLTDPFWETYQRDGRKFNFEDNYHWNPYGVSVVADAILDELGRTGAVPPVPGGQSN